MFNPYTFQGGVATIDPHTSGMNGQNRIPENVTPGVPQPTATGLNYGGIPSGVATGYPSVIPQNFAVNPFAFAPMGVPNPYGCVPNYGSPVSAAIPTTGFAPMTGFAPTPAFVPTTPGINPIGYNPMGYNGVPGFVNVPTTMSNPFVASNPYVATPAGFPSTIGFNTPFATPFHPIAQNLIPAANPFVNPLVNPFVGQPLAHPAIGSTVAGLTPFAGFSNPWVTPPLIHPATGIPLGIGQLSTLPWMNPYVSPFGVMQPAVGHPFFCNPLAAAGLANPVVAAQLGHVPAVAAQLQNALLQNALYAAQPFVGGPVGAGIDPITSAQLNFVTGRPISSIMNPYNLIGGSVPFPQSINPILASRLGIFPNSLAPIGAIPSPLNPAAAWTIPTTGPGNPLAFGAANPLINGPLGAFGVPAGHPMGAGLPVGAGMNPLAIGCQPTFGTGLTPFAGGLMPTTPGTVNPSSPFGVNLPSVCGPTCCI